MNFFCSNKEWDEEGPVAKPDRDRWLHDKLPCPCNKCKKAIPRLRRVCLKHVEDEGLWEDPRKRARGGDGIVDWQRLSQIDTAPHWSVIGGHGRRRIDERMRQEEVHRMPNPIAMGSTPPMGFANTQPHSVVEEGHLEEMVNDLLAHEEDVPCDDDCQCEEQRETTEDMLLTASRTPLYEGAVYSILRASLELLNLQVKFGWSNTSVDELLKLLSKMLPKGHKMPENRRRARSYVTALGMDYHRIHACVNDCMLFCNDRAYLTHCPMCKEPRYKDGMQGTSIPRKVLRHFPIIPRIQHMFKSRSISELITWHASNRSSDGVMRVPADSPAWKHIEDMWPEFKEEPRHLRLGLATDGVNPFGNKSTSWSTWPVVVVNYNIPPWSATKKGHILLSLLVPGKYKVSNIDVYLEPLMEEL